MSQNFINRNDEFKKIEEGFKESQIILVNGKHKIGTTSFLKEIEYRFNSENSISVFIEMNSNKSNISECIVMEIAKEKNPLIKNTFVEVAKSIVKGEVEHTLLKDILKDFPLMGETLSSIFVKHKNKEIYYCLQEVDPFLKFLQVLVEYYQDKGKRFILIIDNLHLELEMNITEFLPIIKNKNNIKLVASVYIDVIGYINDKFSRIVSNALEITPFCINIEPPSLSMIHLLAKADGKSLSDEKSKDIFSKAKGNIYDIFNLIKGSSCFEINQFDNKILTTINMLSFIISKQELYFLMCECLRINIDCNRFSESLITLKDNFYIQIEEETIIPKLSYDRKNIIDIDLLSSIISFYLKNVTLLEKDRLKQLIVLSKNIYTNNLHIVQQFYFQYVLKCIKTNDLEIQTEDIKVAFGDCSKRNNVVYAMYAFFTIHDFEGAYEYYSKIKNSYRNDIILNIFWSITLNRVRKQDDAEKAIINLLSKNIDLDSKTILCSYLLVNYIYQNNMDKAETIYNKYNNELVHSKYYSYFVRNSISVISHDTSEAINILKGLIEKTIDDNFLKASLENNIGRTYLSLTNYDLAKYHLDRALDIMTSNFKLIHSAIILNNLAIYYFQIGNRNEAINKIRLAEGQSLDFMQKCFILLNKYTFLFEDNPIEVIRDMDVLEKEVMKRSIPHLSQVYYSTRCLFEAYNNDIIKLKKYVKLLSIHKDILRVSKTDQNIKIYKGIINDEILLSKALWKELYVPIYLVYWYVNPLNLLNQEDFGV